MRRTAGPHPSGTRLSAGTISAMPSDMDAHLVFAVTDMDADRVRFLRNGRCWRTRDRGQPRAHVPAGSTGPGRPARHPGPAQKPAPQPSRCRNAPVGSRRKITCMVSVATAAIMRLCFTVTGAPLYPCQCHIATVPAAPPPLPAAPQPGTPGTSGTQAAAATVRPPRTPGTASPDGGQPARPHSLQRKRTHADLMSLPAGPDLRPAGLPGRMRRPGRGEATEGPRGREAGHAE
jgi:hypothetical protein